MMHEGAMADRFRGALLGLAIGDAFGARLEVSPAYEGQTLAAWIEALPSALPASGNIAMMMATAASLIEARGFHADHMAETLATQYRVAYGDDAATRVFDEGGHEGEGEDEPIDSASSFGNGAALRAAPMGLFYHHHPEQAAEVAAKAAWFTHAHPLGVDGAALQAAAVAELMQPGSRETIALLGRLRLLVRTRWFREHLEKWDALSGSVATTSRVLGNGVEAHRSVPTALYCFLQNQGSFPDALLFALSVGGHTSALASMTGALAGASLGQAAIPETWLARLDDYDKLTALADGLLEVAEAPA